MRKSNKVPKVRIAKPAGRPFQLRYFSPEVGREVRVSCNTRDEHEAERQREQLQARLVLGLDVQPKGRQEYGPGMSWDDFREEYSRLKQWRSGNASYTADYRLNVCESIVAPKRLRDMTKPETLARLQAELATSRSPHTVSSYLATLIAALNWAHKDMGWLPEPVRFKRAETEELETHKGRPLIDAEFQRMLEACDAEIPADAAAWRFLLRGLWETGLRLSEALMMSWHIPKTIQPLRHRNGRIVLQIPAALQKSKKDQTAGTSPGFVRLLEEVPEELRTGWVFNLRKRRGEGRLADSRKVGRIISGIGRRAGVLVNEEGKPASAHDLRRSFGQRMADAGVPPLLLKSIMRHRELSTTQRYYLRNDAALESDQLAMYLGTLAAEEPKEKGQSVDVSP